MKIYEQADRNRDDAVPFRYLWVLDGVQCKVMDKQLRLRDSWRLLCGDFDCHFTRDWRAAKEAALQFGLAIETNGTHAVIGAPLDLATA